MSRLWRNGRPTRGGWLMLAIAVVLLTAWWRDGALFRDMIFDDGAAHRFQRREFPD